MKKWLVLCLVSFCALATPKQELADRLTVTKGFSAQFNQSVKDAEGTLINQGTGHVDITRPSLFRWETFAPDENLIVSDGKNVWYYSPFVEQVSIYNQDQATAQTPFVLLTRNNPEDWQQYDISQQDDVFTLTPVAKDSNQGVYHIAISPQGVVKSFDVLEQDGQETTFTFNDVKLSVPSNELFHFDIPEGVEVDDQRN